MLILAAYISARKLYYQHKRRKCNYPPGECGLPLIGNLLSMWNYEKYVSELTTKYGDLFMIKWGTRDCVVINSYELCKKYLKKAPFQDHGFLACRGYVSFVELNGTQMWNRRTQIHQSFTQLLDWDNIRSFVLSNKLNIEVGDNINMYDCLNYYVFTLVFTRIFGKNVRVPSAESLDYKTYETVMASAHDSVLYGCLFSLIFGKNNLYDTYGTFPKSLHKLMDIIGKWMTEYELVNDDSDCTVKRLYAAYNNKETVFSDVMSIFIATFASSTRIMVHCLINASINKSVQDIVFDQLNKMSPHKMEITNYMSPYSKSLKLGYFRAFIFETLRLCPVPFGTPRSLFVDNVKIENYNVPKGAIILSANFHIMRKYCEENNIDYYKFDLSNFLDKLNQFKPNQVLETCIFGFPPRNCVGKALALRLLYLMLSDILTRYRFQLSETSKKLQLIHDLNDPGVKKFTFKVYKR